MQMRLHPARNPFFEHAEMKMFLARSGERVLGRIAAIIDHRHEDYHGDGAGFFGFFESVNDTSVAGALLDRAAAWLFRRGKKILRGPVNPSLNDETGLLVQGFDRPPMVFMTYNPPSYQALIEDQGLKKIRDLYAYKITSMTTPPERLVRFAEKVKKSERITIRSLDFRDVKGEADRIREVYNQAWINNWGFVPLTEAEIKSHAELFKLPVVKKKLAPLVLFAEVDGEPIGFSLTVPNFNEVFQRMKGRLLPLGIFRFFLGVKGIKTARVYALGVKSSYRMSGVGPVFYIETLARGRQMGYEWGEMSWILEDNEAMNKAIRFMGGELYKIYRIYEKRL